MPFQTPPSGSPPRGSAPRPLGALLRELGADAGRLVRQEITLARAEVRAALRGAAAGAGLEPDLRLDGGIAAGIQHFEAGDLRDLRHKEGITGGSGAR